MNVLPVQNSQKERHFHVNKHDKRHKYDEMLNQDNDNQDGMSSILRTHMERTRNLIYEHDMDAKRGIKDTHKCAGNYNQEYDKIDTQKEIYFGEQD